MPSKNHVSHSLSVLCVAALAVASCSKKDDATKAEPTKTEGAAAPNGSAAAANPPSARVPSAIAAKCNLPEPTPAKLGAPDSSYAAMFDAVAKCDADAYGRCDAADDLVEKAKKSVPEGGEAPGGVVAACVAGLDHASERARKTAADCLMEIGQFNIKKEKAFVVARLLDKVEAAKDSLERLPYAQALGKLDTAGAGYTCRVIRLIDKLPKDEAATADLMGSLHGFLSHATDVPFDYAYELVMADQPGVTSARAMEFIATFWPEARKGEVCDRLGNILKAGVDGWGQASTAVWKDESCKHRDAVVTNAVAKLKWLEPKANFKEIDRPLLNANFIDDLPTWEGISDAQKKSVCDAAKSLEANAKNEDAQSLAKKIVRNCK
ncbi:hypothetical protein [Polyangium sp. 6x1]|uniref:hypothetical protein n=1 Tax=Polyangium sp. 6x1 TaxID=3042689 RepID=UPI002482A964|nr:hypothetical protein [Polyangium sp. 6x1]MDI1446993.1 hypothetical protein [Polyangium sp. 6x1]